MRVIAGTAKGMKLASPRGRTVRPTSDRVREALYNVLGGHAVDAAMIDLFAGSGAVGIEALSRGAVTCVFVEKDKKHLALIKENLAKTGLTGKARLIGLDSLKALELLSRDGFTADLIFMDPPYLSPLIPAVVEAVFRYTLLKTSGLLVVEHSAKDTAWCADYPYRQKKYGDTMLTFIQPPPRL